MKYPPHEEGSEILQETRGFNIIFIHSSLDDAGLTPQEFRLFAHLSRRAGAGVAFAAAASMAKACRMHPDTVWTAIAELERRNMVVRETRPGKTTRIRLTKPSDWRLQPTGLEGHPLKPGDGNGGVTPTPPNRVAPTGLEGHEGNPLNVSTESHPLSESDVEAGEIYKAYPKKVARPDAIRAIKKALKTIKAPRLLDLTLQFAASQKTEDPQYTPYPATWFNRQQYNDDPSTWKRNATYKQNPAEHPRNRFIAGAGTGPTTSEIIKRNKERAAREAAERLPAPAGPVASEVAPATEHAPSDFGSL